MAVKLPPREISAIALEDVAISFSWFAWISLMPWLRGSCIPFVVLGLMAQGCAIGGAGRLVMRQLPETVVVDSKGDARFLNVWLVDQRRDGRLQWFIGIPPEINAVRGSELPKKFRKDLTRFREDRQALGALSRGPEVSCIEWWDGRKLHHEFQLYSGEPLYFVKATKNAKVRFYQVPRPWLKSYRPPNQGWRRDWQTAQQLMVVYCQGPGGWRSSPFGWGFLLDQRDLATLPMDRFETDFTPLFAEVIGRLPPDWRIEYIEPSSHDVQEEVRIPQVYVSRRPWFLKSKQGHYDEMYYQIPPSYTKGAHR